MQAKGGCLGQVEAVTALAFRLAPSLKHPWPPCSVWEAAELLPPAGQASRQIGESRALVFSDLWEKAPSVQVKELAQEPCAA